MHNSCLDLKTYEYDPKLPSSRTKPRQPELKKPGWSKVHLAPMHILVGDFLFASKIDVLKDVLFWYPDIFPCKVWWAGRQWEFIFWPKLSQLLFIMIVISNCSCSSFGKQLFLFFISWPKLSQLRFIVIFISSCSCLGFGKQLPFNGKLYCESYRGSNLKSHQLWKYFCIVCAEAGKSKVNTTPLYYESFGKQLPSW